jgi:hypothetical protein
VPPLELYSEAVLTFADIYVSDERRRRRGDRGHHATLRSCHLPEGLHWPFFGVVAHAGPR